MTDIEAVAKRATEAINGMFVGRGAAIMDYSMCKEVAAIITTELSSLPPLRERALTHKQRVAGQCSSIARTKKRREAFLRNRKMPWGPASRQIQSPMTWLFVSLGRLPRLRYQVNERPRLRVLYRPRPRWKQLPHG